MWAFGDNAESVDDDDVSQRKQMLLGVVFKASKEDLGVQQQEQQQQGGNHYTATAFTPDLTYGPRINQLYSSDAASGLWNDLSLSGGGGSATAAVEAGAEWLGDDAFLMPSERIQQQQPEVVQDEDEQKEVTPVERSLQLTIAIPAQSNMEAVAKREKDGADGEDDAYQKLSPRSRRKRKNRDQMRQARQKEKDTMQTLRDTVERLEAKYVQAVKEKATLAAADSTDAQRALRFPYMTWYTQSSAATLGNNFTTGASSKYSELISATSRLKEENFRLKQTIHEKHKLKETLERFFSDFVETAPASPEALREGIQEINMGESCSAYVPMTAKESWMLIRDTHERVRAVHQSIAKRAQERSQQQQSNSSTSKPSYFGWQIEYHTQGSVLLFAFEKPFYHVTALQAMEQMWTNELAMKSYRSASDAANQTLKIVQHLNEDTYVFQRRMLDQSTATTKPKYIKTTYIRFRLKTAQGYLIGLKTIDKDTSSSNISAQGNQREEQDNENLSWASKICVWTEFLQEHSPYGSEFCVARLSGFTNLQSGELNCRVVVDTIIQLLRWENVNIGPVITLSSD